ncbi:hypothetical protein Tco_0260451, partial [Tanacetum coccineum]
MPTAASLLLDLGVPPSTSTVVHVNIPNITLDVVTDDVVILIPIVPLVVNVVAYLSDDGSLVRLPPLPSRSLVLPPPLPVGPPVLLPRGAAVDQHALRVVILGGIIYTRDDIDWYRNLRIVLMYEQKLNHLEEALPEAPYVTVTIVIRNAYTRRFNEQQEEEGQYVSTYALEMKGKLDQMERLGYHMPLVLSMNLNLTSLSKDYEYFVQNYSMHNLGNTIIELHTMLKLVEKGIPKNAPTVLATRQDFGAISVSRDNLFCFNAIPGDESVARILNMVPIKKVDKTPYEIWHGKVLNQSYLKVLGCEALNGLILQEASGSTIDFDEIQRQDAKTSENTSEHHLEAKHEDVKPQSK